MSRAPANACAILSCLLLSAGAAATDPVPFDGAWKTQRLTLFGPQNDYGFGGDTLRVTSQDAVSLAYRELDPSLWGARRAAWSWAVDAGVPPTDLTRKGGDDRDLSLYFMFLPEDRARELRGANATALLNEEAARILVYVWGGDHAPGEMLESPYLNARGRTVVLQPAGTGSAAAEVDLAGDHARAFGGAPEALVGIAVSADSDDTDSRIDARISDLRVD